MSDRLLLKNQPIIVYPPGIIVLSGKTGIATSTDGTATDTGTIMRIRAGKDKIDIGKGTGDVKPAD
jgi:hypothetical protein